jgi:hypothetical protein
MYLSKYRKNNIVHLFYISFLFNLFLLHIFYILFYFSLCLIAILVSKQINFSFKKKNYFVFM